MTLPIVSEIPIENRMEFGIDGTRATRAFTVIAPAPHIALTRLYQVENIRRGTVYRDLQGNAPNANLRCRSLTPSPWVPHSVAVDGMFRVDCQYEEGHNTRAVRRDPIPGGPPSYLWDIGTIVVQTWLDKDDNPIINSKKQPYRDGVPTSVPVVTLEVRWFTDADLIATFVQYAGATNSDPWHGILAGQARCVGIKPQYIEEAQKYLNVGRFEARENGFPTVIKDEDDQGQLLNGRGDLYGSGNTPNPVPAGATAVDTGGGVYLIYYVNKEREFAALGI